MEYLFLDYMQLNYIIFTSTIIVGSAWTIGLKREEVSIVRMILESSLATVAWVIIIGYSWVIYFNEVPRDTMVDYPIFWLVMGMLLWVGKVHTQVPLSSRSNQEPLGTLDELRPSE